MPSYTGKNGTTFAYDEKLQNIILLLKQPTDEVGDVDEQQPQQVVGKVDPGDLLEFAEFLFDKARYESVARLRVRAGDVLLVRTPGLASANMSRIEQQVREEILKPIGLEDKVAVVALDGALDLEVIERG